MNFADIDTVKQFVKEKYSTAKQVIYVEHGYDNIVVLIDGQYALRFPRNESAYARSQYERLVLKDLKNLNTIPIPKVLGEYDSPPCLITSYLTGQHLSVQEINNLARELQIGIGEDVASFSYTLHSMLPPDKAKGHRKQLKLDEQVEEPWDIYFEKMLSKQRLQDSKQDAVAKKFYSLWKDLKFNTPTVVVHDDLHNENLLFKEGKLVGVLDFGDTNIGIPEQELRQLYRINDTILNAAVSKYEELSGLKLNLEAIKIWAIVQELAVYEDHIFEDKTHPSYYRAIGNLNKWIPEVNWGKSEDLSEKSVNLSKQ